MTIIYIWIGLSLQYKNNIVDQENKKKKYYKNKLSNHLFEKNLILYIRFCYVPYENEYDIDFFMSIV